jgi:acetyl-CoA C-acetyltransferase
MNPSARRVAIVGGSRIPFARANTVYGEASNQDMLTAALRSLVSKYALENERLGEVAAGAVIKHSRDWNLARESLLGSGLNP